jgi:hypothetical protein
VPPFVVRPTFCLRKWQRLHYSLLGLLIASTALYANPKLWLVSLLGLLPAAFVMGARLPLVSTSRRKVVERELTVEARQSGQMNAEPVIRMDYEVLPFAELREVVIVEQWGPWGKPRRTSFVLYLVFAKFVVLLDIMPVFGSEKLGQVLDEARSNAHLLAHALSTSVAERKTTGEVEPNPNALSMTLLLPIVLVTGLVLSTHAQTWRSAGCLTLGLAIITRALAYGVGHGRQAASGFVNRKTVVDFGLQE